MHRHQIFLLCFNFSRAVLPTFFPVSQYPDLQTCPTSAFPRSSVVTLPCTFPPIQTPCPGAWGKGEWDQKEMASEGKEVPAEAWRTLKPRSRERRLEPCGEGPRGEQERRRCRCTHSA